MARLATVAAGVALAIATAAGCGPPEATVRQALSGAETTVTYDTATFQLARGARVQFVLFRRVGAPLGTADPDFEFVYLELPERARYGWLRQDDVPVRRWVHEDGVDHVWRGTAGRAALDFARAKRVAELDFRVTLEPAGPTSGGILTYGGDVRFAEDVLRTQGLLNQYAERLDRLLERAPPGR
jgi:hypothetical protein